MLNLRKLLLLPLLIVLPICGCKEKPTPEDPPQIPQEPLMAPVESAGSGPVE